MWPCEHRSRLWKERGGMHLPKRPVQRRHLIQPNHWSLLCSDWRFYLEIVVNHKMLQERVKMNSNLLRLTATFMHILSDQVGRTIDRSVALFKLQLPTRWARRSWSPRTFWPRRSPGRSADRSIERTPINTTSNATTCNPWWPWCFSVSHPLTIIDPLMMLGPFRGHRGCFWGAHHAQKGIGRPRLV